MATGDKLVNLDDLKVTYDKQQEDTNALKSAFGAFREDGSFLITPDFMARGTWSGRQIVSSTTRLCTSKLINVRKGDKITIQANGWYWSYGIYVGNNTSSTDFTGWQSGSGTYTLTQHGKFFMQFKASEAGTETIVPSDFPCIITVYCGPIINLLNGMSANTLNSKVSKYDKLCEVPFGFTSIKLSGMTWSDFPSDIINAAVIHVPYTGELTGSDGYYVDLVFPFTPATLKGEIRYRIASETTVAVDWKNYSDDSVINGSISSLQTVLETAINTVKTHTPYAYGNLTDYSNIYEIPFPCVSIRSNRVQFADIPTGVTHAGFVKLPYCGLLTGDNAYYIELLFAYGPASVKGNVYWRISKPGGIYFDWVTIRRTKARNKWVAFGDSITQGYNGSTFVTETYPKIVAEVLDLDGTNEGVSGTGFFVDGMNTGKNGYEKITTYNLTDVNLITIAFGINDYRRGTQSLQDISTRVNDLIQYLGTNYPLAQVIFITPLFNGEYGNASTNYAFGTAGNAGYTLQEMTDAIVSVCKANQIPVIDQSKVCIANKYNYSNVLADRLHPTANGYVKLGNTLAGEISKYYLP